MNIVFVFETNPLAANADALSANAVQLAKAHRASGHRVSLVFPLGEGVSPQAQSWARRLATFGGAGATEAEREANELSLFEGRTNTGLDLWVLGRVAVSANGERVGESIEVDERFARSAIELILSREVVADVVHAFGDKVSPLFATKREDTSFAIVATSTASQEDSIPFGIDYGSWNPATDGSLASRFDRMDPHLRGKGNSRYQELRSLRLREDEDQPQPLFLWLVREEDIAQVQQTSSKLEFQPAHWILMGENATAQNALTQWNDQRGDQKLSRIRVLKPVEGTHDTELRRALGAADFLIYTGEDSSWARRAHRYATLPVVSRTASHAEVIVPCDVNLESGDGFLFDIQSNADFEATLSSAIAAYARNTAFLMTRLRAARIDHSIDRTQKRYEGIYQKSLQKKTGTKAQAEGASLIEGSI